ncbi:hypothetical protein DP116_04795 [Brasilonema bromeliae SPC951]|uniref:Transposase n=1 Tax=Brasilonema bromeliae SPC951 TaxID=385972 RepID=A0ABX1P392_9CYAN|nr:hypothetical protein [Brasilonema bromeliae SPC951]
MNSYQTAGETSPTEACCGQKSFALEDFNLPFAALNSKYAHMAKRVSPPLDTRESRLIAGLCAYIIAITNGKAPCWSIAPKGRALRAIAFSAKRFGSKLKKEVRMDCVPLR